MKVVHICLDCCYVEGMGYQENILPRVHAQMGHDVTVISSDNTFNNRGNRSKKTEKLYIDQHGVKVVVLERNTTDKLLSKLVIYKGLYEKLTEEKPDFIMVHGLKNLSYLQIAKYLKKINPDCRVIADSHADYYNAGPKANWKGKIFKSIYRCLNSYMQKFYESVYGTTPWRVTYAKEIFGIKEEKAKLLVMGGDDEYIHLDRKDEIRTEIREKLNIEKDDFVVITGGKIDRTKNIHLLMEAVSRIDCDKLKLIVFGQPNDEMEPEIEALAKNEKIRFIGWIKAEDSYDYFLASDLAVFPGTHSVLWEQACACGVPCVFKDWEGMHHVDIGGNCEFLREDSAEEMKRVVESIAFDEEKYEKMRLETEKGIKIFSYRDIAKRVIEG